MASVDLHAGRTAGVQGFGGDCAQGFRGPIQGPPETLGSIEQRDALSPEGARVSFPDWFRQVNSWNGERFWALVLPDRPVVSSGHLGKLRSCQED